MIIEDVATQSLNPSERVSDDPFHRLMASVGYLMFHWSALESTLVEEIRRLRIAGGDSGKTLIRVRGSLSERLAEWRALLSIKARGNRELAQAMADLSSRIERLRSRRDMIARNFAGVDSGTEGAEPVILCADGDLSPPTSDARRVTLSEMAELIENVSACRGLIAHFEKRDHQAVPTGEHKPAVNATSRAA